MSIDPHHHLVRKVDQAIERVENHLSKLDRMKSSLEDLDSISDPVEKQKARHRHVDR